MQFKCTKCDKVFYNEDQGCEGPGCEPKHWRPAALIHLLIESPSGKGVGKGQPPKFTNDDNEPYDPAPVPLVLACKPDLHDINLARHNATNAVAPVTCELCRRYIDQKIADLTEPAELPTPTIEPPVIE